MSISRLVSHAFDPAIRERGELYVHRGAVHPLVNAHAPGEVWARVDGGSSHRTCLTYDSEARRLDALCTCAQFAEGEACKHVWASLLAAERTKRLPDVSARLPVDVLWRNPPTDAPELKPWHPPQPDWREKLRRIEAQSRATTAYWESTGAPAERQASYAVDLDASVRAQALAIRLYARDYKVNGELGVRRRVELTQNQIAHFNDPVDRALLWDLLGRTENADPIFGYKRGTGLVRVALPFAADLLARIGATGRLFRVTSEAREREELAPYVMDPRPWHLRITLVPGDDGYRATGDLTNGERALALGDAIARLGALVFYAEGVVRTDADKMPTWFELFTPTEPVVVRASDVNAFLEHLHHDCPSLAELRLPEQLRFRPVHGVKPRGRLIVRRDAGYTRYRVDRQFGYDGEWVDADDGRATVLSFERRLEFTRDPKAERALDQTLGRVEAISTEEFLAFVDRAIEAGWEVFGEGKSYVTTKSVDIQVVSGVDWFDVHADVKFGEFSLATPQLLRALKAGERLIELGNGAVGILPEDWQKRFGLLGELAQATADGARLGRLHALVWKASLGAEVRGDASFRALGGLLADLRGRKAVRKPKGFKGELRPYQKDGLRWLQTLRRHGLGGILADDMGLGKTVQVLALLAESEGPTLIVAPKSLVFNWRKEAARFTPNLRVLEYTGTGRARLLKQVAEADIVLTTYQSLRRDVEKLSKIEFKTFILDEAHHVKNPNTAIAMACQLIRAKNIFCLTGTPVENRLGDLFSILSIANPGFVTPEQARRWGDKPDADLLDRIARGLSPFLLRRTKEQVLSDLPAKTENVLYCELSEPERRKYGELRAFYWGQLSGKVKQKGLARSKIEVLEALLRLRQAACHQGLLDGGSAAASAKFEVLLDQLATVIADGHRALVFSQFTSLLKLLIPHLRERGIAFEYLDGQTQDREERVKRFQTDETVKVFLLSLKAGGVGLNLTGADYVYVLDPWWNPAAEAQAIDRAHRLGQKKSVFAYRLIAKDTVEEKILELQESKKDLARAVVGGNANLLKNLKLEDLEALFS